MRVYKMQKEGGNYCVFTEETMDGLSDDLASSEIGEKYTIEIQEMSDEDFIPGSGPIEYPYSSDLPEWYIKANPSWWCKPNHKGIECVCEFKPISHGPVFVFENQYETVYLSETGTQCIPKDGSASTVYCSTWRAMPSLAHRITRYQHSGYKQIG